MYRWLNLSLILVLAVCLSLFAITQTFAQNEDKENDVKEVEVIHEDVDEHDEDVIEEDIVIILDEAHEHAAEVQKEMKKVHKEMKRVQVEMDKVDKKLHEKMPRIQKEIHSAIASLDDLDLNLDLDLDLDLDEINFDYKIESQFGAHKNFKGKVESASFDLNFTVGPETPLIIKSQFGSYMIEPGEPGVIKMEIEKTAGASTEAKARELLEKIKLQTKQTAKGIELTLDLKTDEKEKQNEVFFHTKAKITVPVNTPLSIDNQFGDVGVRGIHANIECRNQFGATRISDTSNDLGVFAQFGPLTVSGHDGPAKVNCGFGELTFLTTSHHPLSVKASYGKSKVVLDLPSPNFEGSFSFGEGLIYIPKHFAGRIEAAASFGDIKVPDSLKRKKEMFSESAQGELGDGDGSITASSSYAPLRILFNDSSDSEMDE